MGALDADSAGTGTTANGSRGMVRNSRATCWSTRLAMSR